MKKELKTTSLKQNLLFFAKKRVYFSFHKNVLSEYVFDIVLSVTLQHNSFVFSEIT